MTIKKLFILLLTVWTAVSPIYLSKVSASSEEVVAPALAESEEALVSAYQVVLEAEETGADVSDLLVELNDAGEALAGANTANRVGNVAEAGRLADLSLEISEAVRDEAYILQVEAHGSRVVRYWLTSVGSLAGMVAVVLGSLWTWRFFKRRFYQRLLGMKPEVISNES